MTNEQRFEVRLNEYLKKEDVRGSVIAELLILYQKYASILDKGWINKVVKGNDDAVEELILELVVVKQMSTNDVILKRSNAKKNELSPDFLLNVNNHSYMLEVTSVRLPEKSSVVKSNSKKFKEIEILSTGKDYVRLELCSEIKSRITNSFIEKANKYSPLKYKFQEDQGLIIFISTGKIPFHSRIEPYELVSVFFGTGDLTFVIDVKKNKCVSKHYSYKPTFNKNNGKPISNEWLLFPKYKHVSGVILSQAQSFTMLDWTKTSSRILDWRSELCNDFILIHNPHAHIPVPKGILPVRNEISYDIENSKIVCQNESVYPI